MDYPKVKVCLDTSEDNLIDELYTPCLKWAERFDRGVGYFTTGWLTYNVAGLSDFASRGGKMRLITSPILSTEDTDAIIGAENQDGSAFLRLEAALLENVEILKQEMEADIINTFSWMLYDGITDSNLNHTGIYLYSKGKIMIHLTFDYQSDEGCTTPGQYLRYHRTFQGLTTRELAEKVGVVPATLVLYENDRHPIKHSTAVALANVLGIDRSRLLDEYTVFVDYPYSSLLKKVRRELSFTQMQMAEVIGIGQTTYSGWEREVRVPRRKEHEKILAAMKKLKVDVDTYLCQPNPL